MLAYLRTLGARWLRMIVGPAAGVIGIAKEFFPRLPGDLTLGPYVLNVWLTVAFGAVFIAQYKLWRDVSAARAEEQAGVPVLAGRRPTQAEVDARRAAEDKRKRGERLNRKERQVLARRDLGVTKAGILESLGYGLQLGEMYAASVKWEGEEYRRQFEELASSSPTEEEANAWFEAHPYDGRKAIHDVREWRVSMSKTIGDYLHQSYVSRFESDAGLTPPSPPAGLTDSVYADCWQSHQNRLARLHQIIEELTDKWS